MDFLKDFGVQPILLAAQVVNFLILLLILKRFLYKPILRVLEERKRKIEESLQNAQQIDARLAKLEKEREKVLEDASKEAQKFLADASKNAEGIIKEAHQKAARDAEKLIENAQKSLAVERAKLQQELRSEVAELVGIGLKKIVSKTLTEEDKKGLLEKSIREM